VSEIWNSVAGKLTDKWASALLPAALFWGGGLLAWVYAGPGWSRLARLADALNAHSAAVQVVAVFAAIVVVMASALVVQRLTFPALRLLEGYWPGWALKLAEPQRRRILAAKRRDDAAFQNMQKSIDPGRDEGAAAPYAPVGTDVAAVLDRAQWRVEQGRLQYRVRHRPLLDDEMLPTRIGNIMRAAETLPNHRYGLDTVVAWPCLWLVLPKTARDEIAGARTALDASVAAAIWGVAFMTFSWWAWWAAPLGLAISVAAVALWVPDRAGAFADLLLGAYALYRTELYRQLRWPLPRNPAEEQVSGPELTQYLVFGSDDASPCFTTAPEQPPDSAPA
jgi:hypothetical protein